MSEIVGTYGGVDKTLDDLWSDYRKELIEIGAVAMAAVSDLENGSAVTGGEGIIFHEARGQGWKYVMSKPDSAVGWVPKIGGRYGWYCDDARGTHQLKPWLLQIIDVSVEAWLWTWGGEADEVDALTTLVMERVRQNDKWGPQHHDKNGWAAVLGEEFGEMCEAAMRIDHKLVQAIDGGKTACQRCHHLHQRHNTEYGCELCHCIEVPGEGESLVVHYDKPGPEMKFGPGERTEER